MLRALAQKCPRLEKLAITNGADLDNQPKSLLVETFANIIMNLQAPDKLKCLWASNMTNDKDEYMEAILGNLIHFKVFNLHQLNLSDTAPWFADEDGFERILDLIS